MKTIKIIAIDPDVKMSGVAFLDPKDRKLEVMALTFPQLIDYLLFAKKKSEEHKDPFIVIVEAGWLNHSNWHTNKHDNVRTASMKGTAIGRNHEIGRKIIEMCEYHRIDVLPVKPLRKIWKGIDGKITQEELEQITGLMGKTNQDGRDAALLAWVFAELPIQINNKKTSKKTTHSKNKKPWY
jgi:hypothetical protein